MEHIALIPTEILKLIPLFGGDKRQLNLFLRKCEYVIDKFQGSDAQNVYIMHAITSRLVDRAAALISEREDIVTWSEFKDLLIQHFGDPRSEECIAIELENLKIKTGESYLDFCNRVQSVRSVLLSKVNHIVNEEIRQSKIIIYNNTSLNVFLYNLPENLVRIVRLKTPKSLESALSVVLEEMNFQEQYNQRNKYILKQNNPSTQITQFKSQNHLDFHAKPGYFNNKVLYQSNQQPQFKFGIPQASNNPPVGFRPNLSPYKFGIPKGPHIPPPRVNPYYGHRPFQQVGYRPPFNANNYNGHPTQFGYKPNFNKSTPNQNDVSMRSALPNKPNLPLNEMYTYDIDYDNDYDNNENMCSPEHVYDPEYNLYYHPNISDHYDFPNDSNEEEKADNIEQPNKTENFCIRASNLENI